VCGLGKHKKCQMCVEAAVAFASGEGHHDHPACVDYQLAATKISLNDAGGWKNSKSRARGLRRLAIAQLGSNGDNSGFTYAQFQKLFYAEFSKLVTPMINASLRKKCPQIEIKNISDLKNLPTLDWHSTFAATFDTIITDLELKQSAYGDGVLSRWTAADILRAAGVPTHQERYFIIAELYVRALIRMKVPGTKYLYLAKVPLEVQKYFD
jgi:hypothetical protein